MDVLRGVLGDPLVLRTVPLPRFLPADLEPLVEGKEPDGPVFTSRRGDFLRGRNVRPKSVFENEVVSSG